MAKSHIVIDCRFAHLHAGLGRYTRGLVPELIQNAPDLHFTVLCREKSSWTNTLEDLGATIVLTPIPHYSFQEQTKLPKILKGLHSDVFFSPHFNVPFFCPLPKVVTIHDLILHHYPNEASFLKQAAYRLLFGRAVRRSLSICAVSEATANDLCAVYGNSLRRKIIVTGEGVEERFTVPSVEAMDKLRAKYALPGKFLLYVGNSKPHKNLTLLLHAFKECGIADLHLVLVTDKHFVEHYELPPRTLALTELVDEDLPTMYGAATAFVTPSVYEGYGLPVAEALACGCPVLSTNCTSLPEVIGTSPGAIVVPPEIPAFTEGIRQVIHLPRPQPQPRPWSSAALSTLTALRLALSAA